MSVILELDTEGKKLSKDMLQNNSYLSIAAINMKYLHSINFTLNN